MRLDDAAQERQGVALKLRENAQAVELWPGRPFGAVEGIVDEGAKHRHRGGSHRVGCSAKMSGLRAPAVKREASIGYTSARIVPISRRPYPYFSFHAAFIRA